MTEEYRRRQVPKFNERVSLIFVLSFRVKPKLSRSAGGHQSISGYLIMDRVSVHVFSERPVMAGYGDLSPIRVLVPMVIDELHRSWHGPRQPEIWSTLENGGGKLGAEVGQERGEMSRLERSGTGRNIETREVRNGERC